MQSPYLKNEKRLADVIAAIQVLATYKFYKLDLPGWSKRITGSNENGEYWKMVFEDHPEFFRLTDNKEKASLAWRRSYQRRYHVDHDKILTKEEIDSLDKNERHERVSRIPLSNSDIATLISTAIDLHARAIESEKEKRWLLPSLVTILAVMLGAILKSV